MKDESESLQSKATEDHLTLEVDKQLEAAEKVYHILQEGIQEWQEEDHPALAQWTPKFSARPYFTLGDLPEGPVLELWQRLNECMGVEVSPEALAKDIREFKEGRKLPDQEMLTRLSFAFSGVAGWLRKRLPEPALHAAEEGWQQAVCPVCGEDTRLSLLIPPVGKRELYCRICGHTWPGKRVGCIICGSENASSQTYLHSPEFPGLEIAVCEECGEYFKEIDLRTRSTEDLVWEDVRTLPLNYAAEQWLAKQASEKGSLQ